jgi:hypothetical protein
MVRLSSTLSLVFLFCVLTHSVSSVDDTVYGSTPCQYSLSEQIAQLRANKTAGHVIMYVGVNASHPMMRLYGENGLSEAVAGCTAPDNTRPIDLAFDGSIFSHSQTNTTCHPCTIALKLDDVYVHFV